MIRLIFAFVLAPLVGSLAIWAAKGSLHSLKVSSLIAYSMALIFWLPMLLVLRRRQWLKWWQVTLGGLLGAIVLILLYRLVSPDHFEKFGAFNSLLFAGGGMLVGIAFWSVGIAGNEAQILSSARVSLNVPLSGDPEGPSMVVRHTNTFLDALAFSTVQNLRSIPLLTFNLAGAAIVSWQVFPDEPDGFLKAVAFSEFTLFLFVLLMAFQLLFNAYWYAWNRDENFLTEHTTELTETAFIASTVHTRAEIKWPGVFAVRQYLNRLFIFEGPTKAHCIPARAFATRAEFDAFAKRAKDHWRRSRIGV